MDFSSFNSRSSLATAKLFVDFLRLISRTSSLDLRLIYNNLSNVNDRRSPCRENSVLRVRLREIFNEMGEKEEEEKDDGKRRN